ncbi:MAG TPA: hypothetical protein VJN90_00870 [Candidatus Acidoferrales bacterium]|nr:hypothetical protein [Candidatus Acidoferrales bacterium]
MKFDCANRDTEAIGDLFVYTIAKEFLEHFTFARAKWNRAGQAAAKMQEFLGARPDALNQAFLSRNPHGVVLGQLSSSHASKRQHACCPIYGRFPISIQLDLES